MAEAVRRGEAPLKWRSAYSQKEDSISERNAGAPTVFSSPEVTVRSESGVTWDDNIFISGTHPESDTIFHVSSLMRIRSGDFTGAYATRAAVEYTPRYLVFLDHSGENTLDHDAAVDVQYNWSRLTMGVKAGFEQTSGGTPDLGERVDSREFRTEGMAAYAIGGRTRTEFTAAYTSRSYDLDTAFDSEDVSGKFLLDYEISPRTHLAIGGAAGQLDSDGSSAVQDYRQGLVRAASQLTSKWKMRAEGGFDQRDAGNNEETTPVFEIGMNGSSRSANLDLSLARRIYPSGSQSGLNYISTRAGLYGSQRVSDRFRLTLGAGVDWLDYTERSGGSSAERSDTYYFLRPGFSYDFNRFRADVYYEFVENSSSGGGSYNVNRAGLALGAEF